MKRCGEASEHAPDADEGQDPPGEHQGIARQTLAPHTGAQSERQKRHGDEQDPALLRQRFLLGELRLELDSGRSIRTSET